MKTNNLKPTHINQPTPQHLKKIKIKIKTRTKTKRERELERYRVTYWWDDGRT